MHVDLSPSRFSSGYDREEVDAFVDRLEHALVAGDGSLSVEDVQRQRFSTTSFAEAYVIEEVDAFLDRVAVPMLRGELTYDPQARYSARGQEAARAPRATSGHPAETGLLDRFLGWLRGAGR